MDSNVALLINDFTNDEVLQRLLIDYLDVVLPGSKLTPISCNYQLKKLLTQSDTIYESKIVLLYTLCNGYKTIYSYKSLFPNIKEQLEHILIKIEEEGVISNE